MLHSCHSGANQAWFFDPPLSNSTGPAFATSIKNRKKPNLCLQVPSEGSANQVMTMMDCNRTRDAQKFYFTSQAM